MSDFFGKLKMRMQAVTVNLVVIFTYVLLFTVAMINAHKGREPLSETTIIALISFMAGFITSIFNVPEHKKQINENNKLN